MNEEQKAKVVEFTLGLRPMADRVEELVELAKKQHGTVEPHHLDAILDEVCAELDLMQYSVSPTPPPDHRGLLNGMLHYRHYGAAEFTMLHVQVRT